MLTEVYMNEDIGTVVFNNESGKQGTYIAISYVDGTLSYHFTKDDAINSLMDTYNFPE